jgi:hypothetical protein
MRIIPNHAHIKILTPNMAAKKTHMHTHSQIQAQTKIKN